MIVRKILASLLAIVTFLTNGVFCNAAESNIWLERRQQHPLEYRAPRVQTSPQIVASESAESLPVLKLLPRNVGTVQKISVPSKANGKVVLHIQDVHLNPEAQSNIAQALQPLFEKGVVSVVGLEGAFGPMDFSWYRAYPNQRAVRTVGAYLLQKKRIGGPVFDVFNNSHLAPSFVGVDDREHYNANVDAYRRSVSLVPLYKKKLAEQRAEISHLKKDVFNPALKEFDDVVTSLHEGSLRWDEYVSDMARRVSTVSLNLQAYLTALELERHMDVVAVESQRQRLLARLLQRISSSQSAELLQYSSAYRTGVLGHADFYAYLKRVCERQGLDLREFPEVKKYMRYVTLIDHLNVEDITREINEQEQNIYERLATNDRERELIAKSQYVDLAGKLLDFALTKQEWARYQALNSSSNTLKNVLGAFESFYREAELRDGLMGNNFLAAIRQHGDNQKTSVLVTGGFHSSGIDRQLTEEGFTVILYSPKVSKIDDASGSSYLSAFTQEKTPLDKLFAGEKLFLAALAEPNAQLVHRLVELEDRAEHSQNERVTIPFSHGILLDEMKGRNGSIPEFRIRYVSTYRLAAIALERWGIEESSKFYGFLRDFVAEVLMAWHVESGRVYQLRDMWRMHGDSPSWWECLTRGAGVAWLFIGQAFASFMFLYMSLSAPMSVRLGLGFAAAALSMYSFYLSTPRGTTLSGWTPLYVLLSLPARCGDMAAHFLYGVVSFGVRVGPYRLAPLTENGHREDPDLREASRRIKRFIPNSVDFAIATGDQTWEQLRYRLERGRKLSNPAMEYLTLFVSHYADALRRTGRGEDALSMLKTVVPYDPHSVKLWSEIGFTYSFIESIAQADIDQYQIVAAEFPMDPLILASWGQLCLKNGQIQRGIDDLDAFFARAGRDHTSAAKIYMKLRLERANSWITAGRSKEAIADLEDLAKIDESRKVHDRLVELKQADHGIDVKSRIVMKARNRFQNIDLILTRASQFHIRKAHRTLSNVLAEGRENPTRVATLFNDMPDILFDDLMMKAMADAIPMQSMHHLVGRLPYVYYPSTHLRRITGVVRMVLVVSDRGFVLSAFPILGDIKILRGAHQMEVNVATIEPQLEFSWNRPANRAIKTKAHIFYHYLADRAGIFKPTTSLYHREKFYWFLIKEAQLESSTPTYERYKLDVRGTPRAEWLTSPVVYFDVTKNDRFFRRAFGESASGTPLFSLGALLFATWAYHPSLLVQVTVGLGILAILGAHMYSTYTFSSSSGPMRFKLEPGAQAWLLRSIAPELQQAWEQKRELLVREFGTVPYWQTRQTRSDVVRRLAKNLHQLVTKRGGDHRDVEKILRRLLAVPYGNILEFQNLAFVIGVIAKISAKNDAAAMEQSLIVAIAQSRIEYPETYLKFLFWLLSQPHNIIMTVRTQFENIGSKLKRHAMWRLMALYPGAQYLVLFAALPFRPSRTELVRAQEYIAMFTDASTAHSFARGDHFVHRFAIPIESVSDFFEHRDGTLEFLVRPGVYSKFPPIKQWLKKQQRMGLLSLALLALTWVQAKGSPVQILASVAATIIVFTLTVFVAAKLSDWLLGILSHRGVVALAQSHSGENPVSASSDANERIFDRRVGIAESELLADLHGREVGGLKISDVPFVRVDEAAKQARLEPRMRYALRLMLAFGFVARAMSPLPLNAAPPAASRIVRISVIANDGDLNRFKQRLDDMSTAANPLRSHVCVLTSDATDQVRKEVRKAVSLRSRTEPIVVISEGESGFQRGADGTYSLRDLFLLASTKTGLHLFKMLSGSTATISEDIRIDILTSTVVPYVADDELARRVWYNMVGAVTQWIPLTLILSGARSVRRMA